MSHGGRRSGAGRPGWKLQTTQLRRVDVRIVSKRHGWDTSTRTTMLGNELVAVEWQACRFGGHRAWFRCPACARRCALLYLLSGSPRCARCLDLAYPSQSMDRLQRSWLRTWKLEAKLGISDSRTQMPIKAKWKHWDRFSRLCVGLRREQQLRDVLFCRTNAAFMGWDPASFDAELEQVAKGRVSGS